MVRGGLTKVERGGDGLGRRRRAAAVVEVQRRRKLLGRVCQLVQGECECLAIATSHRKMRHRCRAVRKLDVGRRRRQVKSRGFACDCELC